MGVMGYDVVNPVSNYSGDGSGGGGGDGEAAYAQRLESNRLLRILERTLLIGGSIDAEALCVQSGVWVWRLVVDVSLVTDAGNGLDACVLAVVAALRHFRLAQVDTIEEQTGGEDTFREMQIIDSDEKEPTPLPLHHTPVTATFAFFSDKSGATSTVSALIDPTDREELAADGIVTWSYNKYGEMCCLDFPGGCELSVEQLMSSSDVGKKRCIEICEMLETALVEAESKAEKERMERLKKNAKSLGIEPMSSVDDVMDVDADNADAKAEDEEYRKLALDYASGHIAASVKDRPLGLSSNKKSEASSLFHAFLHSVKKGSSECNQIEDDCMEVDSPAKVKVQITKNQGYEQKHGATDDEAKQKFTSKEHKAAKAKPVSTPSGDSSDEEENVVQLHSEFSLVDDKSNQKKQSIIESTAADKPDNDSVEVPVVKKGASEGQIKKKELYADDLAMAVKKKSKKSKKRVN